MKKDFTEYEIKPEKLSNRLKGNPVNISRSGLIMMVLGFFCIVGVLVLSLMKSVETEAHILAGRAIGADLLGWFMMYWGYCVGGGFGAVMFVYGLIRVL